MIDLLNQQLSDVLDLGLQAKQAHWNVKGPHFVELYEPFDMVAEELEEFTDDIAARTVQLGGVALGTIQVAANDTRLEAYCLRQGTSPAPITFAIGAGEPTGVGIVRATLQERLCGFPACVGSERLLYNAQDAFVQSAQAVAQDLVMLYRALGGGWKTIESESSNEMSSTSN